MKSLHLLRYASLILVLYAPLTGCGDDSASAPDAAASPDDGAPGDSTPDASPDTAFLDEALDCRASPGTGVTPGEDLLKVTLDAPLAICNDGSPAVMYVRRAANEENRNNWVFHLQGGGGCGGSDCSVRWCTRTEKMTSIATPPGMLGKGIMRRDLGEAPLNALGDANQVFLYYCSSDNWAGQSSDAVIPASDDSPAFRLHFRGEAIHNAALDALEAGVTSDDGTVMMPRFEGDGYALWTGTSGGCQGVANTADRFATRASSQGFSPGIICDANFGANPDLLPEGPERDAFLADRSRRYDLSSAYSNANRDTSCMAALGDSAYLCEHSGYVLANHITSAPLFVRMDFADPVIGAGYETAGFSAMEIAQGVRASLLSAAAGEGTETPVRPISVYGPACGQHVGLTDTDWFFRATVDVGGDLVTFHDAVVAWLGGRDVVAVDTVPSTLSACAATTDERD